MIKLKIRSECLLIVLKKVNETGVKGFYIILKIINEVNLKQIQIELQDYISQVKQNTNWTSQNHLFQVYFVNYFIFVLVDFLPVFSSYSYCS